MPSDQGKITIGIDPGGNDTVAVPLRGSGKSWAQDRLRKFAKRVGEHVETKVKGGLKMEQYDVLGKTWVFYSLRPTDTDERND